MKKYYYLLMVMFLAVLSVGFASCGDDEDEPKNSSIVGTWQIKAVDDFGTYESLIQFTKNGKWHSVDIYTENGETEVEVEHGTYSISGDKLYITYTDDGEDFTETVTYAVKGDKLTLTYMDYPVGIIYARVKDSVIEKYL